MIGPRLVGALAALLLPMGAMAQEEEQAPLPLPELPADDWERGAVCSGFLLSVMLVLAEEAENGEEDDTGLFDRLSASFEWWGNTLAARPDYSAERYKQGLSDFLAELVSTENPDAALWTSNVDACVGEAEDGGAGLESD